MNDRSGIVFLISFIMNIIFSEMSLLKMVSCTWHTEKHLLSDFLHLGYLDNNFTTMRVKDNWTCFLKITGKMSHHIVTCVDMLKKKQKKPLIFTYNYINGYPTTKQNRLL